VLQTLANAVRPQRALIDSLGGRIELWNIKGTPGNAELAANAVFMLEIHDAIEDWYREVGNPEIISNRGRTSSRYLNCALPHSPHEKRTV
jgi:hypothetical protein